MILKQEIFVVASMLGALFTYLVGGHSTTLTALLILMAIDIFLGFFGALVLKRSKKTRGGKADSTTAVKGISRKGLILIAIVFAHQVEMILGVEGIREGAIIGYAVAEAISILEHFSYMGLPIPKVIRRALEIMHSESEEKEVKKADKKAKKTDEEEQLWK